MSILPRLMRLYEDRGIAVSTGLNPAHFGNFAEAPYTWFIEGGASLTNGLGISAQEVYFLECLFEVYQPQRSFVIGNSLGWSTLAIALARPGGEVIAIDAGFDRNAVRGIDLTNRIAAAEGLPVRAVKAVSPGEVAAVIAAHLTGPVDFAFIDGGHSVAQVEADFDALRPHAADACVYLFHDVETFRLHAGISAIAARAGLSWQLLLGTTSGMAIMAAPTQLALLQPAIRPFTARPEAIALLRREAWARRHRHLARWRRSLQKRLSTSADSGVGRAAT